MALLVALRSPELAAPQAGQRLLIDLIAPSKQARATVIGGAASAHTGDPMTNAQTVSRTRTTEITPAKNPQAREISKASSERQNITASTVTLTTAEASVSRPAPQSGASEPHPVTEDRPTSSSLSSLSERHLHAQQDNSQDMSVSVRVKARLIQALRDHFSYPKIARRYGWEGLVEMRLRVEANGRLSHIELVRSSGYAALDEAALSSTRRIDTVVEAADWLNGSYIDLSVPVEYRLVDG